jgi:hypothetical protein
MEPLALYTAEQLPLYGTKCTSPEPSELFPQQHFATRLDSRRDETLTNEPSLESIAC